MKYPHLRTSAAVALRTRFMPKNRIGHGLISAAPWLNILLLLVFFLLFHNRIVLQPGCVIDLPTSHAADGSHVGLAAVVRSVQDLRSGTRQEIIYFNDSLLD